MWQLSATSENLVSYLGVPVFSLAFQENGGSVRVLVNPVVDPSPAWGLFIQGIESLKIGLAFGNTGFTNFSQFDKGFITVPKIELELIQQGNGRSFQTSYPWKNGLYDSLRVYEHPETGNAQFQTVLPPPAPPAPAPLVPIGTLFYVNENFKMVSKPFYSETVFIDERAFVCGIVKNGKRVSPVQYSNLSDLEIFALNGQFFDLNLLNDKDILPFRTIELINLTSIYDLGQQANGDGDGDGETPTNPPLKRNFNFYNQPLGMVERSYAMGETEPYFSLGIQGQGITWSSADLNAHGETQPPALLYCHHYHEQNPETARFRWLNPEQTLGYPRGIVVTPFEDHEQRSIFAYMGDWYFVHLAKGNQLAMCGIVFNIHLETGNPYFFSMSTDSGFQTDQANSFIHVRTKGLCSTFANQFVFVCWGYDEAVRLYELGKNTLGFT